MSSYRDCEYLSCESDNDKSSVSVYSGAFPIATGGDRRWIKEVGTEDIASYDILQIGKC